MKPKTVSETHTTFSHVMQPGNANFMGNVFGGAILSMIDLAAYACASKFAENVCVTASFDRVDFKEPIYLGELVTMEAYVSYVGRTSVEVTIDVVAESIPGGEKRNTNSARVTMVALKDGKPAEVPRLICETHEDKVRFLAGRLRRERRFAHRAEYDAIVESYRLSSDEELDRLMAAESLHQP